MSPRCIIAQSIHLRYHKLLVDSVGLSLYLFIRCHQCHRLIEGTCFLPRGKVLEGNDDQSIQIIS